MFPDGYPASYSQASSESYRPLSAQENAGGRAPTTPITQAFNRQVAGSSHDSPPPNTLNPALSSSSTIQSPVVPTTPVAARTSDESPGSGKKRRYREEKEEEGVEMGSPAQAAKSRHSTPGSEEKKRRITPEKYATPGTVAARQLANLALRSPGLPFPRFEAPSQAASSSSSSSSIPPQIAESLEKLNHFESLLDTDAKELLDTLDIIFFNRRNTVPEGDLLKLYSPKTIFDIYNLYAQTYGDAYSSETRRAQRSLTLTVQLALNGMTVDQREELLNFLSVDIIAKDPRYRGLSEICFAKYFLQIDPPKELKLTSLPSYETTLKQVVQKADRDLEATDPAVNVELCQQVKDLALQFLNPSDRQRFPLNHAFHVTSADRLPHFIEHGIPVSHGKTYPGAFTSSAFEPGFGSVGVAVSTNRLAAMQRSLTRIERRYAQDGGHIWLGSEAPLPIVPDLITYSSNLSEEELSKLQAMITPYYPECLFIASDVLEKFLEYAREDHWFTPVPPMTTPESVRLQSRPPEEG